MLEVDLEYLDELHELHNYYPFASGKLKINHDICQIIAVILQINIAKNWWF